MNAEIDKRTGRVAARIDNGHNGFDDVNTCILCIRLTGGVLFSHGTRYGIDFVCGKEG